MMSDDTRDRVIALETDVKHLSATVDTMAEQVKDMHTLLQQAKGARWAILTMAAVGGFIASKLGALIPFASLPPR